MNANEAEPITRETPYDVFLDYIVRTYLATERFDTYLTEHQSSFGKQELVDFFQSLLVADRLRYSWEYERDPNYWSSRTTQKAINESIGHTLDNLKNETDLFLFRGKRNVFPHNTVEEVQAFKQKFSILIEYFCEALPYSPQ